MRTVAALYVDPRGPYVSMPGVDPWTATRDARRYPGPHPVVAHPPCAPWSKLRYLNKQGTHDCAIRAVEQVRTFGGVLEHPAGSALWAHCGLPRPETPSVVMPRCYCAGSHIVRRGRCPECGKEHGDCWDGYTIEVTQVEWGHVARKRTWLYLVGVPRSAAVDALKRRPHPGKEPTHWCSGSRNAPRGPVPPGIKVCSAQQRRRTPPAFAALLVNLARQTA